MNIQDVYFCGWVGCFCSLCLILKKKRKWHYMNNLLTIQFFFLVWLVALTWANVMTFFFPFWNGVWGDKAIWLDTRDGYLPALGPPSDPLNLSQLPESKTSGLVALDSGNLIAYPQRPAKKKKKTRAIVADHSAAPLAVLRAFVCPRATRGNGRFRGGSAGRRAKSWRRSNARARNIRSKALAALLRGCTRSRTLADGVELLTCGYGR